MVAQYSETTPDRTPFWFKPVSTFGLFKDHDVNLKFTYVGRSRSSLAPYRLSAGSFRFGLAAARTDDSVATLSPELHTRPLPASHVRIGNG